MNKTHPPDATSEDETNTTLDVVTDLYQIPQFQHQLGVICLKLSTGYVLL